MYSFSSQHCRVELLPKPSAKERLQVAAAAAGCSLVGGQGVDCDGEPALVIRRAMRG